MNHIGQEEIAVKNRDTHHSRELVSVTFAEKLIVGIDGCPDSVGACRIKHVINFSSLFAWRKDEHSYSNSSRYLDPACLRRPVLLR